MAQTVEAQGEIMMNHWPKITLLSICVVYIFSCKTHNNPSQKCST